MPSRYETASSAQKLKEELDEVEILQQTKVVDFQTLYFYQEKDERERERERERDGLFTQA